MPFAFHIESCSGQSLGLQLTSLGLPLAVCEYTICIGGNTVFILPLLVNMDELRLLAYFVLFCFVCPYHSVVHRSNSVMLPAWHV